jgi:two-component system response regulator DesR
VAEDRLAHRVVLCAALKADRRIEVSAAAVDGPEALGATLVTQPDIAVLDDHLAFLRGRDVAVQLRLYAPQTKTIVLVNPLDRLFTARPSAVDAIYPRDGDRRALVDLIARVAA